MEQEFLSRGVSSITVQNRIESLEKCDDLTENEKEWLEAMKESLTL